MERYYANNCFVDIGDSSFEQKYGGPIMLGPNSFINSAGGRRSLNCDAGTTGSCRNSPSAYGCSGPQRGACGTGRRVGGSSQDSSTARGINDSINADSKEVIEE